MRRFLVSGLLALACLAFARPVHAQLGGIGFGVAGGITAPQGDAKDAFKTGFHAQGQATLSLPLVPIGFRGELAYDQMSAKAAGGDALKLASGDVNATFGLPFPVFHPYASGGIGYYVHNAGTFGNREGKVGFNGGVGVELKLPMIPKVFAEARYHTVKYGSRVSYIPVTVGIEF